MRYLSVNGYENRTNDVIYTQPLQKTGIKSAVIYFGGDIQDFTENMETHRDNKNYLEWSLDKTSQILQNAFPDSHIILIRPSRMEYKTFSCFENFTPCENCGVPRNTAMHHAIDHLEKLIENLEKNTHDTLSELDLVLIGFSKGCVVLNQFLYEFYTLQEKTPFVERIKTMFWLDGGHSGGKNTWVTSKAVLESLAKFEIQVRIHVSPYQIQDDRRPWIKKEERIFYNTLCGLNVDVGRRVHSPDLPPTIYHHFAVLNEFNH
ncbi:UPF0565 protein C2orf69 homolog isoform X2 [Tribolium madens]|uniref:UPF0565 protein C2orf69 homolog isoform X2 n=1 Tax=Tribolium madens TaxID=41895 RepID=UPI001CF72CB8|nr:UPF0565 protein C2orf69 homolog isoform X2 [Tribolium madens]